LLENRKGFQVFSSTKNEVEKMNGGEAPASFFVVPGFGTIRVAPQQSPFPSSQEQNKSN